MADLGRVLVFLSVLVMSKSMEKSSMYMKKSNSEDMEASASGYNYQGHSGEPFTYKTFKSDTSAKFNNFANPSIDYEHYKDQSFPLPLSPAYVPSHYDTLVNSYGIPVSYAAYVEPVKGYDALMDSIKTGYSADNFKPSHFNIPISSYGIPISYAPYVAPLKGYDAVKDSIKTGIKDAINQGTNSAKFVKSGGLAYEDNEKASRGEKGERGYLTLEGFEKALKGAKENDQHKGFYKEAGGNKAGFSEIADHYSNKNEASKGNQGESFSDKKDNKKGSKTTGYHKIYHKDDYKKDHSFYDKADKNGYFRRYGDYQAKQDAQQGGFKKGGHHDSGFKEAAFEAKGLSDKGSYIDEDKGYKGAAGDQKYYQNTAEYANKAGKEFAKEQGFRDNDKFGVDGY